MRALLQRVTEASVAVDGEVVGAIGGGFCILLGVGGQALIVSQFTLYANARRGRRPSFTEAAPPDLARDLYERFCKIAAEDVPVATGIFAAEMQVSLVNDGPITVWLDTDELF